jgi:hypothetical protein
MSNTTPVTNTGYITVAYPYQGTVYNFTFYEGFVGRILLRPQGGAQEEVYKQQGVYHVPQPSSGEVRGPDERSTVKIAGGPSNLDIELEVGNGPMVDFKGPINKIRVRARRERGAASGQGQGPSVRVLHGEEQVDSLSVEMKPGRGVSRGGVEAFQTSGGDEVTVENEAVTCPPAC